MLVKEKPTCYLVFSPSVCWWARCNSTCRTWPPMRSTVWACFWNFFTYQFRPQIFPTFVVFLHVCLINDIGWSLSNQVKQELLVLLENGTFFRFTTWRFRPHHRHLMACGNSRPVRCKACSCGTLKLQRPMALVKALGVFGSGLDG